MKVYTRIEIDMGSGAVLWEESHEYDGPVALCGGKGSRPSPPPTPAKPSTGKDITAATTQAVDDQQRRVKYSMGQQGTILTSPLGAQPGQQPTGKTLLGQ